MNAMTSTNGPEMKSARGPAGTRVIALTLTVFFLAVYFVPLQGLAKAGDEVTAELVLDTLPLSDRDKENIFNGKVVDWVVPWDTSTRELSVGGAFFIAGKKPEDLVHHVREPAEYKILPIVKAMGEIKGDGTIDDFQDLVLEPNGREEAKRYLAAEGSDTLNLSPEEIALFQNLNNQVEQGGNPQERVEKLLRRTLLARYQDYRTKGLTGIAPYDRDGDLFYPGTELVKTSKNEKYEAEFLPDWYDYFLNYPTVTSPKVGEKFYWVNFDVFDRPTLALSHQMWYQSTHGYLVIDRHFYASHDYNTLQMGGGIFATKGGTLAVYLYRVSTDQVSGFGSSVKRPVARKLMETPIRDLYRELRTMVEKE